MTLSKLPNTSVIQRWSHVSPAIIHTPLPSSDAGASWGHSSPWRWLVYDPPSFLTTLGLRQESGTALAGPAVTQGSSEARVFQRCQVLVLKGKVRWLSYQAITSSQTVRPADLPVPGWTRHRDAGRRHMSLPSGCFPTQGKTVWGQ